MRTLADSDENRSYSRPRVAAPAGTHARTQRAPTQSQKHAPSTHGHTDTDARTHPRRGHTGAPCPSAEHPSRARRRAARRAQPTRCPGCRRCEHARAVKGAPAADPPTNTHRHTDTDTNAHHITSHHITSHHITPHHITATQNITSHHISSHHIISHHFTPHHMVPPPHALERAEPVLVLPEHPERVRVPKVLELPPHGAFVYAYANAYRQVASARTCSSTSSPYLRRVRAHSEMHNQPTIRCATFGNATAQGRPANRDHQSARARWQHARVQH